MGCIQKISAARMVRKLTNILLVQDGAVPMPIPFLERFGADRLAYKESLRLAAAMFA